MGRLENVMVVAVATPATLVTPGPLSRQECSTALAVPLTEMTMDVTTVGRPSDVPKSRRRKSKTLVKPLAIDEIVAGSAVGPAWTCELASLRSVRSKGVI